MKFKMKYRRMTARSPDQLGHALKRARLAKGWTQMELSEESGVRQAGISLLERGHGGVKLDTVFKIMAALDWEFGLKQKVEEEGLPIGSKR